MRGAFSNIDKLPERIRERIQKTVDKLLKSKEDRAKFKVEKDKDNGRAIRR